MKIALAPARALALTVATALPLAACGQGPSFDEKADKASSDAVSTEVDENGVRLPEEEAAGALPSDDETAGDTDEADDPANMPDIPEADDEDLDALHRCLSKWKNDPFKGTVDNYYRINASVSVGGIGNAVKDVERTDEPFLVLIDAAVNVLGAPTYQLMNPNGYYCMKVNVNVLTDLTINLHCNARLADSKVSVNVGSTQNDSTSAVGVHVLSNVDVKTVSPEGDSCIR